MKNDTFLKLPLAKILNCLTGKKKGIIKQKQVKLCTVDLQRGAACLSMNTR